MFNISKTKTSTPTLRTTKLSKNCFKAKKFIMGMTTFFCMAAMFATPAYAAGSGVVDTSSFITTVCTVLKSVICLIGGGLGVWGIVSLIEAYGSDNAASKPP